MSACSSSLSNCHIPHTLSLQLFAHANDSGHGNLWDERVLDGLESVDHVMASAFLEIVGEATAWKSSGMTHDFGFSTPLGAVPSSSGWCKTRPQSRLPSSRTATAAATVMAEGGQKTISGWRVLVRLGPSQGAVGRESGDRRGRDHEKKRKRLRQRSLLEQLSV